MNFPKDKDKENKNKSKTKTQIGLFLFFLSGLLLLQVVFSFTTHGDIGPRTDIIPGIEKPASPVLIGKIDSLVEKNYRVSKVVPEGAFAPATRNFESDKVQIAARIDAKTAEEQERDKNMLHSTEVERFVDYTIQKGDTLQKISRKLYGNNNMVRPIVRINRITDEKSLNIGSTLKVPRIGLVDTVKIAD